jgi:hypothetical protein
MNNVDLPNSETLYQIIKRSSRLPAIGHYSKVVDNVWSPYNIMVIGNPLGTLTSVEMFFHPHLETTLKVASTAIYVRTTGLSYETVEVNEISVDAALIREDRSRNEIFVHIFPATSIEQKVSKTIKEADNRVAGDLFSAGAIEELQDMIRTAICYSGAFIISIQSITAITRIMCSLAVSFGSSACGIISLAAARSSSNFS